MNPSPRAAASDGELERLAPLVEDFLDRRRSGEQISPAEFARGFGAQQEPLRDLLETLEELEGGHPRPRPPPARPTPARPTPARLGPYRILGELGRGGMGVIYLAEHGTLERWVALKILPPGAMLDPHFRARFEREARAVARLTHPRIVPVYETGEADGVAFYAMQFVDGESLDRVIARLGGARPGPGPGEDPAAGQDSSAARVAEQLGARALSPSGSGWSAQEPGGAPEPGSAPPEGSRTYHVNVARIGLALADALAHAHARGVVHRDVKPGNVLLDGEGRVWIGDFGLCKLHEGSDLTASSDAPGTLRYMAPEQVEGVADARSDVYGLGATLYELLALRPAFDARERGALLDAVLNAPVPRLARLVADVPRDLEAIVLKAMARLPEERYPSAEALRADLEAFLEGRPVAARVPGALHLLRLAARRNRGAAWALAAGLTLTVALTALYIGGLQGAWQSERRQLSLANLAAAQAALRGSDAPTALERLERVPPEHRDWTWRHLAARADQSLALVTRFTLPVTGVVDLGDGRLLAAAGGELFLVTPGAEPQPLGLGDGPWWILHPTAAAPRILAHGPHGVALLDAESLAALAQTRTWIEIWCAAVSPDGERVALGLRDGTIRILGPDLAELERLRGPEVSVRALAFVGTAERLATGSWGGEVRLWELPTRSWRSLYRHPSGVHRIVASPDGEWIASASADLAHLQRTASLGDGGRALASPGGAISDLALDPAGDRWVLATAGGSLHVHHMRTLEPRGTFLGAGRDRLQLSLAPGGGALSGGQDGRILIWHLDGPGGGLSLDGHVADVWGIAFDPSGRRVAYGGRDTYARVLDARTGRRELVLAGHGRGLRRLAWTPDGGRIATGDVGGGLRLWDGETGELLWEHGLRRGGAGDLGDQVAGLALDGAGALYAALEGGEIERWEPPEAEPRWRVEVGDRTTALALLEGGGAAVLFVGTGDGRILRLDPADGRELSAAAAHEGAVRDLAVAPEGARIGSVGDDGVLRTWTAAGAPLAAVRLTPTPDGDAPSIGLGYLDRRRIAVGMQRSGISVRDADSGEEILRLGSTPVALAVSAAGERLAYGGWRAPVVVWDTLTARERLALVESAPARPPHPSLAAGTHAAMELECVRALLDGARPQAEHRRILSIAGALGRLGGEWRQGLLGAAWLRVGQARPARECLETAAAGRLAPAERAFVEGFLALLELPSAADPDGGQAREHLARARAHLADAPDPWGGLAAFLEEVEARLAATER